MYNIGLSFVMWPQITSIRKIYGLYRFRLWKNSDVNRFKWLAYSIRSSPLTTSALDFVKKLFSPNNAWPISEDGKSHCLDFICKYSFLKWHDSSTSSSTIDTLIRHRITNTYRRRHLYIPTIPLSISRNPVLEIWSCRVFPTEAKWNEIDSCSINYEFTYATLLQGLDIVINIMSLCNVFTAQITSYLISREIIFFFINQIVSNITYPHSQ